MLQPPPPPPPPAALPVPAKAPVGAPQYIVPPIVYAQPIAPFNIIPPTVYTNPYVNAALTSPGAAPANGGIMPNSTYAGLLSQPFFASAGAANNVSQWSTFPAISDIDAAGYSILNAADVVSGQFQTSGGVALNTPSWDAYSAYQEYSIGNGAAPVGRFQIGLGGPNALNIRSSHASAAPNNGIRLDLSGNVSMYQEVTAPSYLATNGLIQLVDLSGTHQLQAIGGDLFYDTELLARAGDIQNVADWALYPALAAVNIDGKTVSNVESLELDTSGGVPVTLTSDASGNVLANGVRLTTPADVSGAVGQWSTFPAVSDVDMSQNDISGCTGLTLTTVAPGQAVLTSNAGGQLLVNGSVISTGVSGDVTQWATFPAVTAVDMDFLDITRVNQIQGKQVSILGDNAADLTSQGRVDITGQNGLQGQVNITANPGTFGQSVGGSVNITANGGVLGPLTFGGLVTIDANTGSIGSYGAATSAIKMSAAGINSYAGAIPSIASLAGYNFIYGTGGVNICAGLPPLLPNIPLTTYVYGTGGVGLEAGIGAEVEVKNSTLATLSLQPRTSTLVNFGDLAISGRSNIVQPNQYVTLDMVKSLTFDPATAASITNVATINGAAYPPPADLPTQWAVYPAVQNVDISGFSVTNALNITGTGSVTGGTLTTTAGNLQIFDPAPPGTLYGDVKYDSGTGRLAVLPQGTGAEAVAYLSDIPTVLRPTFDIYVAPNGSPTGTGSVTAPLQTIAQALTLANSIPQSSEVTIFLYSGTYTENPTITRGNTYITSYSTGSTRQSANISGTITVGITTTTAFTVGLAGLTITGNIIYNSDTTPDVTGVYTITDCLIGGAAGAATIALTEGETTTHTLIIENCRINTGNVSDPGITAAGGSLQILYTLIQHAGTGVAILSSGNNLMTMRYSAVVASTASTSPSPIVQFNNNAASGSEISFSQLRYSSTAVDASGNKCCVQFANSAGVTATFSQLYLACVGATTGTPNIQCIQDIGAGAVNLNYGDLQCVGGPYFIAPNVTRIPMTQVTQGTFASFSSTLTQAVTGANTVTPITYNTVDVNTNGITQSGSSITVDRAGAYEIIPSLQLDKSGGGTTQAFFWLQTSTNAGVTWTDVPNSSSQVVISGPNAQVLGAVSISLYLIAAQRIRIVFASADATTQVQALVAQLAPYVRPANPSIITTIKLLV